MGQRLVTFAIQILLLKLSILDKLLETYLEFESDRVDAGVVRIHDFVDHDLALDRQHRYLVRVHVRIDHAHSFDEHASLDQFGRARGEEVQQLLVGVKRKEVSIRSHEHYFFTWHLHSRQFS